jgi:hypothetical protein
MLAKQNFLTDENATFVQKLCAEKGLNAVAIKVETKNICIFFEGGKDVVPEHENIEPINILGGRTACKIVGIGEQITPSKSEYRNAKILQK